MIAVVLSARIKKTAEKLPPDVREKVGKTIAAVAVAFSEPHKHGGLGLRKLARRSYEARAHLQWRVVFIHEGKSLVAYDIMDHDDVATWLRGQRK